jgi:hypothetical protein
MLLDRDTPPGTWLYGTSRFEGPVHTNTQWLIWGNPTFRSDVTQFRDQVGFGNCGDPLFLDSPAVRNPNCDMPNYQLGNELRRGVTRIDPPPQNKNSPLWAVLGQPAQEGAQPGNRDIRERILSLPDNNNAIPDGIYFADQCATPSCGGVFIKGDLLNLVLAIEDNRQVVYMTHTETGVPSRKFILDPANTQVCLPPFTVCTPILRGFNGMIFVQGNITSSADPMSGLYGTVHRNQKLTIAADGEIRIVDHLVYQQPPSSGNDPVPNVLGLYAWCDPRGSCGNRNVTVVGADTPNNLFLDASVLAPWGKFWVSGWDTLPALDKGKLRFLGGTVQQDFGQWGGFNPDLDPSETGYGREMTYDMRFKNNNAPPFFPLADVYVAPRWPRFFDILYDRPLWQELARL